VPPRADDSDHRPSSTLVSPAASSPAVPGSPPRKVISSFKPFAAPSSTSIEATGLGGTSGFKAPSSPPSAFGASGSAFGLRAPASPSRAAEPTTDSEEALSGVELKMAGISFEQARKIVDASAWRSRG
jgi:hypothetical protein